MKRQASHIHKLKKHKYPTGNAIFFCTLPDCHYKIDSALALGKRTICNVCGTEFIMNEYTLKLTKPHCGNCGKVKTKDADGNTRYIKKISNEILSNIAESTTDSLRDRLNSATATATLEEDEGDI